MSIALLIVDVQSDFCPGGALAVPGADRVIPVINRLLEHEHIGRRHHVFASRDWHPPDTTHFEPYGGPWPHHCVAGTDGAAFHPELRLPPHTVVISKGQDRADAGYSAFEGTTADGRRLADELRERGVEKVIVGGLATDYCVRASVLDARRAGFDVAVIEDAVAGIHPDTTRQAIDEMQKAGARLIHSEELAARGQAPGGPRGTER